MLEVRSSGSLEGCGGGSVRAVLDPIVPPGPPVPHDQPPPRAETSNSALQSAQSERNVIALPRGRGTRMPVRKGAAYWSPGATRWEERRSLGKTWPCPPALSGTFVLNPSNCPASRTRCVSGPTTQTALTSWKAGPATRIVLTLPVPASVWPRARKPETRQQAIEKYAYGHGWSECAGGGRAPLRFRCAPPLLRASPRQGPGTRAVLVHLRFRVSGVYHETAPPKTVSVFRSVGCTDTGKGKTKLPAHS